MAKTTKNATKTTADGHIDLAEAYDAQAKAWPAKQRTPSDHAREILFRADYYRQAYDTAKAEFIKRANDNPADAAKWAGEDMTIVQTQYELAARYDLLPDADEKAAIMSVGVEIPDAEATIKRATDMLEHIAHQILNHSVGRASSTGHFHNANDVAAAEAYCRTLRDLATSCTPIMVADLVKW